MTAYDLRPAAVAEASRPAISATKIMLMPFQPTAVKPVMNSSAQSISEVFRLSWPRPAAVVRVSLVVVAAIMVSPFRLGLRSSMAAQQHCSSPQPIGSPSTTKDLA